MYRCCPILLEVGGGALVALFCQKVRASWALKPSSLPLLYIFVLALVPKKEWCFQVVRGDDFRVTILRRQSTDPLLLLQQDRCWIIRGGGQHTEEQFGGRCWSGGCYYS